MKLNKKLQIIFVLIVSIVTAFLFCVSTITAAEVIKLKLAHSEPVEHARHLAALKFAELVKERTGGLIEIEIYPLETLGSEVEVGESLQMGTIDISAIGGPIFTNWVPEYGVFGLPFMFDDFKEAYAALDGPIGDKMIELAKEKGFIILSHWDYGFRNITNNVRPINVPEDLVGLKMRVPQEFVNIETFKGFGSSVSPIAFGELYLALQQGVVDGQENPLGTILYTKFYEVQKYLSMTQHIYANTVLIFSEKTWNSISDGNKILIRSAAQEARDYMRNIIMAEDKNLIQELEKQGMKINYPDLSKFKAKTPDIYKKIEERVGKKIIDDMIEFLDKYRVNN